MAILQEQHADGSPVRRDWAQIQGTSWIVYGHTPVAETSIYQSDSQY